MSASAPGAGRPKGSKNKFTTLKQCFIDALNEVGGVEFLVEVAKRSPVSFCTLLAKMQSRGVTHSGSVETTNKQIVDSPAPTPFEPLPPEKRRTPAPFSVTPWFTNRRFGPRNHRFRDLAAALHRPLRSRRHCRYALGEGTFKALYGFPRCGPEGSVAQR